MLPFAVDNLNTSDKKNRVVGVDSKTELGTVTTEYVYGDTSLKQFSDVVYKVKHNGNENISYTYDELGRKKTTTLISGNTTEYTYENGVAGLVSSVTNSYGTDSEDVYNYTYDQFGNITKVTKNGTVIGEYTYDKLGQLISDYAVAVVAVAEVAVQRKHSVLPQTKTYVIPFRKTTNPNLLPIGKRFGFECFGADDGI